MIKELLVILISSSLVNNVVLSQFLGLCPFLGVSKKTETATGMGVSVIFVIMRHSLPFSCRQYTSLPLRPQAPFSRFGGAKKDRLRLSGRRRPDWPFFADEAH